MKKLALIALLGALTAPSTFADEVHVGGKITNLTSVKDGVMVMINGNQVPGNCTGYGTPWMLIKQQYTAMISTTLAAWAQGKVISVYTDKTTSGFCLVNQVDPED